MGLSDIFAGYKVSDAELEKLFESSLEIAHDYCLKGMDHSIKMLKNAVHSFYNGGQEELDRFIEESSKTEENKEFIEKVIPHVLEIWFGLDLQDLKNKWAGGEHIDATKHKIDEMFNEEKQQFLNKINFLYENRDRKDIIANILSDHTWHGILAIYRYGID